MKIRKFLNDFKAFAVHGNVLSLAVGVMIGGAFGKITTSLVNDIFTPLLSLVTGGVDFSGLMLPLSEDAQLNYGAFLTNVVDFVLIAFCVFLFTRLVGKIAPKKPDAPKPATKVCPYCRMAVDALATRCPHCTSVFTQDENPVAQ
ncbi:MAG: large conductance mechanosensitive channel protein MscL [Oscillospiraceae bacterium]|jgi:large conductance mechanosensitive channel|nr:large conductance mechanosensitive channel protein MscL [Oscillospiraceae bacterium]